MAHLPDYLHLGPARREGGTVTYEARVDTSAFMRALAAAEDAFSEVVREARAALENPVTLAGREVTYFVRAGLDPAYRAPHALDGLVRSILLADTEHPSDVLLSRRTRAELAVAAIRGWVHSEGLR